MRREVRLNPLNQVYVFNLAQFAAEDEGTECAS